MLPSTSDALSPHEERALIPADHNASDVDIIHTVPPWNILPVPSHVISIPNQLLTDVNWGPRFRHYVHSPRRSINQWLSVEILAHIFLYAVDAYQMTPHQLVAVCRRWRNVINGMTHLWSTLRLGTWTEIQNVDIWLERSKEEPLTVNIDPRKDAEKPSSSPPYAGLEYAFKSVNRWQHLVVASFPTPEVLGDAVVVRTAKPMDSLKSLEVGHRCHDSATLSLLLDHISKTAVHLSHMTLLGVSAIFSFLQPERHRVLNSVTTLIIDGKEISQPVPILPLLVHLQTFDASRLPLPNYDPNTSLPFLSTLRKLRLRATPIQWMEGREFIYLEDCTIVHAIGQGGIQHRINLPCCRALTYQGHPLSTLQHFHAPQVKEMVLSSHDNMWRRAQQHLVHLCRLDGNISHLHTLHLTLQCSEKALVNVLNYMDPLQRLILTIAYPSPSWKRFLESLAADSTTKERIYWHAFSDSHTEWKQWCSSQTWHANILPSLKYLGIRSPKGFSPSQCLDNLPLLRFVAWTREQLCPPLAELKVWEGRGTNDDIVVDYCSTDYLDKHLGTSREDYDWRIVRGMVTQTLVIDYNNTPLFKHLHSTILFRKLRTLMLEALPDDTHILPCLQHIEELELWNSTIPAYSLDVDLPLVDTLDRLQLTNSTFSWMLGRSFPYLGVCILYYPERKLEDLSSCKGLEVEIPGCTVLKWWGSPLVYSLFSCENVQYLKLWPVGDLEGHGVTFEEAVFKPLRDFILKCSCLIDLEISLDYCLELDSLIQFVFYGAREHGIWEDMWDAQVYVSFNEGSEGSENELDHFFSQVVGRQQQYEKGWKQFKVTKVVRGVNLDASM